MGRGPSCIYHTRRLTCDRRWASAYRAGRPRPAHAASPAAEVAAARIAEAPIIELARSRLAREPH